MQTFICVPLAVLTETINILCHKFWFYICEIISQFQNFLIIIIIATSYDYNMGSDDAVFEFIGCNEMWLRETNYNMILWTAAAGIFET
jgi:hypothetical protein